MLEIVKNSMVTLKYDLHLEDEKGEVIEKASEDQPLQFIFGAGLMLPKFEAHLAGMKEGEQFTIRLSKNDAYGDVNDDAIVELPKHVFLVEGQFDEELISVGNSVPMMSSSGQRMNGHVLEVTEEAVTMDFNHPLAGEDLYFTGKVLNVRPASDEELAQALYGGGCGCGSGGCGDEGCGTEEHDHAHGGCGCGC
jgi:FKBP-type peptidyl-prolyl cis-trans isomerase SlyD